MKYRQLIGSAALALAVLTTVAAAQRPQAPRRLAMTAENLMAGDARHRAIAERGGNRDALMAGDVVRYRIVFTNVSDVPVRNVEFTDPLPAGLRYVAASAGAEREDVAIDYSIDGGAMYSPQPMVKEVVGGEPVQKPAPVEMYTHIRWRVRGWVARGERVSAEFRAVLPGPTQASAGSSQNR